MIKFATYNIPHFSSFVIIIHQECAPYSLKILGVGLDYFQRSLLTLFSIAKGEN